MSPEVVDRRESVLRVVALASACAMLVATLTPEVRLASRALDAHDEGPDVGALIAPFGEGAVIGRGFILSRPSRGREHDVALVARRMGARGVETVDLHILDRGRWAGVRESAHFGIAYEVPLSTASRADCDGVVEELARTVRANDHGRSIHIDELAIEGEPHRGFMTRLLASLVGRSALAVALALAVVTWSLAGMRFGPILASGFLLVLGLVLRMADLDVPFDRDQDIQRLFTGHVPVWEILTGIGLRDRHPPFYFLVLHVAEWFGQSETVVRTPAVLAGALTGPTIVGCAVAMRRRADVAALAALLVTVGATFVQYSREVSSIPFFGLLLLLMGTSVVCHLESRSRVSAVVLVATHALALVTYYTAIFPILGELAFVALLGRSYRATLRVLALACVVGSPGLVLAVVTFFRDRGARVASHAHPTLVWGDRSALELAREMLSLGAQAVGPAVTLLVVASLALGSKRRERSVVVAAIVSGTSFLGIALLAPVARVQPYYVVAALPVGIAVLANAAGTRSKWADRAWAPLVAIAVALTIGRGAASAASLYQPSEAAFGPRFAALLGPSLPTRVVTVAHHDTTTMAYYIARRRHVPVDWRSIVRQGEGFRLRGTSFTLIPLVYANQSVSAPDAPAMSALRHVAARGSFLVVSRDGYRIEGLSTFLARCSLVAVQGEARLSLCPRVPLSGDEGPERVLPAL